MEKLKVLDLLGDKNMAGGKIMSESKPGKLKVLDLFSGI